MNNSQIVEVFSSMECPYAYLSVYRLRQVWPELDGKLKIVWRSLPLEYVNRQAYPKPLYRAEYSLFQHIEPELPWKLWDKPDWEWPITYWPAYEALNCAQAQNADAAFEMSWCLRHAYFALNRNLSLRHEIMAVAEEVAVVADLDLDRFRASWDSGRYKQQVIDDARRGWEELKVDGSATFVLPDGRRVTNPAVGEIDFDEENAILRSYTAYEGDPLGVYREMLRG